jgi:hypothetical protein
MAVRPHYAQSWEDPRLLHALWQQYPAEYYHLIASGGDHALDLLLRGHQNLQLYDLESAQLAHIAAKIEALNRPETERNRRFGYRNGPHGLLHDGRLEGFLGLFARRILPLLVPQKTREALRAAQTPDAQLAIWDGPWQTARWKWVAHRYFEPKRVDESARHPGLTTDGSANARRTKHPINYLGQFRTLLGTHPLADNPFAEYPLFGGYRASGIPYLDQGLSGPVLKQLTLNHQSLDDALRTAPAARRGIHASDILEGRSAREVATFFETVDRACAPGSTLIFWDHRFRTTPPPSWLETWKPATPLPADRVPFYHSVHAYTKS